MFFVMGVTPLVLKIRASRQFFVMGAVPNAHTNIIAYILKFVNKFFALPRAGGTNALPIAGAEFTDDIRSGEVG